MKFSFNIHILSLEFMLLGILGHARVKINVIGTKQIIVEPIVSTLISLELEQRIVQCDGSPYKKFSYFLPELEL